MYWRDTMRKKNSKKMWKSKMNRWRMIIDDKGDKQVCIKIQNERTNIRRFECILRFNITNSYITSRVNLVASVWQINDIWKDKLKIWKETTSSGSLQSLYNLKRGNNHWLSEFHRHTITHPSIYLSIHSTDQVIHPFISALTNKFSQKQFVSTSLSPMDLTHKTRRIGKNQ